jgi:hypothetical protein
MPDDFEQDQPQDPGHLRQMYEAEAQARAAAEAELTALRSESMFRAAGLDPGNKLHAAAMRGYDGEMNADAIGSYVGDLGLNQPPPPQAAPQEPLAAPADDLMALTRMAEAARDAQMQRTVEPERAKQIRAEMEVASRRGDMAALDRLSIELSRANGFTTKWDQPDMDAPSIPQGTRQMPVQTSPNAWRNT